MYLIKIRPGLLIHRDRIQYIECRARFTDDFSYDLIIGVDYRPDTIVIDFCSEKERDAEFERVLEETQRLGIHR